MSHLKERKEKSCLNCNAKLHGKYCSICGQENLEPQESTGHLIGHFFQDITHFDGKFFSSLKYLVTKPGFLTAEYAAGRRASYLNPVRMYVFTSFLFFLILFALPGEKGGSTNKYYDPDEQEQTKNKDTAKNTGSSKPKPETVKKDSSENAGGLTMGTGNGSRYASAEQYDSLLANGTLHDNAIARFFIRKNFDYKKKYGSNGRTGDVLKEEFKHTIPQMLIISLPLFALFLQIVYSRNKKLYYVAHAVFALHLYIFFYIAILAIVLLEMLSALPYLHWLHTLSIFFGLYMVYYVYKAMRNFYQQKRLKTILKYFLLFIWLVFVATIVMLIGGLITFLKM